MRWVFFFVSFTPSVSGHPGNKGNNFHTWLFLLIELFIPFSLLSPSAELGEDFLFFFFEEGATVAALASACTAGPPPEPEHLSSNQSHAGGFIYDQPVS